MLSADIVYHNFPVPDLLGRAAVRKSNGEASIGPALRANWELVYPAVVGNVVLDKRIDKFQHTNGFTRTAPVMGTNKVALQKGFSA